MLKELNSLRIPVSCQYGIIYLNIVPMSEERDKMYRQGTPYPGEAIWQLVEGSNYQYEFEPIDNHFFQFAYQDDIITFSKFTRSHPSMGNIKTGIYVGLLQLGIKEVGHEDVVANVNLEIRSVKADYESDYRRMLDDIADYYTDLVLLQGSPVKQTLEVDDNCPSQSLYQKFSFIRSIIDSEAFEEAIHKIMANPVRKWTDTTVKRSVVGVRRLSRKNIREIATSFNRMAIPESMNGSLPSYVTSIPRTLDVIYKRDTIDNQENQFVKFALRSFFMFCSMLREKQNATDRLKAEIDGTLNQISNYLESQFFRQISMPTHMNMNSPVLQRKEGYREVLQAWLMYDLAARLNWEGGNNVYEAGKKNVATLYEYWLFFKLQELISEFFNIPKEEKSKLVSFDGDNINLNIIQGKHLVLHGISDSSMRRLQVEFYYNKTFNKRYSVNAQGDDPIHQEESWTMPMRPDYTLAIWPGDIDKEIAIREDLITYIHFDAKYRLNKIVLEDNQSVENVEKELTEEKKDQEAGIYKRADLLKMHAYKDAIRRTSGAYILYPGTENKEIRGFHEIIPGLGAFSVRPGHWQDDSIFLRQFLAEVKAHMLDRTSEREKLSYYQYDIYREANANITMESMPEPVGENRDFLPDETSVIVAYYRNQEHLDWILSHHLYNMREGASKGAMYLGSELINARYLLLYSSELRSAHFIRIKRNNGKTSGPVIYTRDELRKMDYPPYKKKVVINGEKVSVVDEEKENKSKGDLYLVFQLFSNNKAEKEFMKYYWNIKDIVPSSMISKPLVIGLAKLMSKAKIK